MTELFSLLTTLFGLCLLFGLIVAALLMPVAPAYARRLLRKLGLAVLLLFFMPVALCALAQAFGMLSWRIGDGGGIALILAWLAVSVVAYLIYKARRRVKEKPAKLRRVERTPILPDHLHAQSDRRRQDEHAPE